MIKSRYQGVIFITISAFFFALMNLFVRLSGDLPTMQKAFFRNVVAAVVALALLLRHPSQFKTAKGNWVSLILRALAGTMGIICNFYAIDRLNIADASVLNKLSPFFSILFSVFLLKEKPKALEWVSVIVAFAGAVFVVRPTFSAEVLPALVGVAGGVSAGLAYTFVRRASAGGASRNLIIFFFSAFSCLVLLPFLIVQYKPMEWWQLLHLLLAGASAAGGQIFITAAYSKAPAKEISVFDYSIVIFSAVLGAMFLSQIPDALSYVGYVVIIGSAAMLWLYHLRLDRLARRQTLSENVKEGSNKEEKPEKAGEEAEAKAEEAGSCDPPDTPSDDGKEERG